MTSWFRGLGALAARVWRALAALRAYTRRAAHGTRCCQRQRLLTLARAPGRRRCSAPWATLGVTHLSAATRQRARARTVSSGSIKLIARLRATGEVLRGSGAVGGSGSGVTQTSAAVPPGGPAPAAAPRAAAGAECVLAARSTAPDTAPVAEAAPATEACPGSLLSHPPSFAGAGGVQPPPLVSFPRRSPSRAARPPSAATAAGARSEPRAAEAAAHAVGDTRRTPDAIRQRRERDGDTGAFPATMPVGPWASSDDAKAELEKWAGDVTTCGGGWGISWCNSRSANTQRGPQRVLGCHLRSEVKESCKWLLTLEESTAGWVVFAYTPSHTHALTQTLAESNSHAAMRGIPQEFHDLVRVLSAAGQPPAAVDKVLRAAADRDNIDVTWVYNDVYHFMTATTAEKAFDATGFLEQLEERRKLYGLPFYYLTDADGRLSRVFVVLAGGLEGYAKSISFVDDVEVNQAAVQYDLTVRYPALHLHSMS